MSSRGRLPEETWFLSVRELGEGLRHGRFRSVDLTEGYLDRLEHLGPRFNAVVTLTRRRAREEARAADRELAAGHDRGPLHGVPYGVKDLLATHGIPTTWGAAPYRRQVFERDAEVVRRLTEAGAVLVAKLAMVELAGGMGYSTPDASFTGPGITPWNTGYWSGGSSSGPGAAVAAGLVGFAIGSETSGSILTPSAYCGVTGLRPTYGIVSRRGAMALSWTLDKLGPMARTAEDCDAILGVIAGRDPEDLTSAAEGERYGRPSERVRDLLAAPGARLRVGVVAGSVEKVQPAVRDNFERALTALDGSVEVVRDLAWPDFPWGPAVGTIVGAEGATAFLDLIESGGLAKLKNPRDRYSGYTGTQVAAVDYLQAMRLRGPMKAAVNRLFAPADRLARNLEDPAGRRPVDVVAAPTRASVASALGVGFSKAWPGVSGGPALIAGGNLCGIPALAVPTGLGAEDLPTSMQFVGPAFSEGKLVFLGRAFQNATDHHRRRPPHV